MTAGPFQLWAALLVACLPLAVAMGVGFRALQMRRLSLPRVVGFFLVAAPFGGAAAFGSSWLRAQMGLDSSLPGQASALLGFHVFLEAPLLETFKALLIWRAYRRGLLSSVRVGSMHGAIVGSGFALGEVAFELVSYTHATSFPALRLALVVPGHVFFSLGWAALLHRGGRDRFFGFAWLGLTASHGFFRDVVLERPTGLLALVVPPMLLMVALGWALMFRKGAARVVRERLETEGAEALLEALLPRRRRLNLLWIAFGSLVTLGVTLTFLALSVFIGNRLGANFSLVDDASLTKFGPLSLFGIALLLAFPFSAYLVARASGAQSVVEPAWSAAAAVLLVLVLLSVTEPSAVIVAVGLAPVAFVLGCLGAWAGLDARPHE